MSNKKYAAEKPEDCSLCFFWKMQGRAALSEKRTAILLFLNRKKKKAIVMDALTDEYIPVLDGVQNR